jgi:hypothetical protein
VKFSRAWWFVAIAATLLVAPALYYEEDRGIAGVLLISYVFSLTAVGLYDWKRGPLSTK